MKQTKTTHSDHFFNVDECADILIRPRNKCAACLGDGDYAEFNLYDVVSINKRHPETFVVPNELAHSLVSPGMLVKIYADWCDQESLDERFWVRITDVNQLETGEKVFYGVSENDTAYVPYGSYLGPILLSNICDMDLEEFMRRNQQGNPATTVC
jgi:hypothetical protein